MTPLCKPGWYLTPHGENYYVMTTGELLESLQYWNTKHARENVQLQADLERFRAAAGERHQVGPRVDAGRRVQLEIF